MITLKKYDLLQTGQLTQRNEFSGLYIVKEKIFQDGKIVFNKNRYLTNKPGDAFAIKLRLLKTDAAQPL